MATDAEVEAAAKAIYASEYDIEHYPWEREPPVNREVYCRSARRALEAAEQVRAISVGGS
jgi:hypothetical protein